MTDRSNGPILRPDRNCWRIERAHRFALIVDAADYFRHAKDAILKARKSVYLIGWDFDTRIRFEPGGKKLEGPDRLGAFLRWIDRNRPELAVHVLKWDLGALQTIARGTTPLFMLNWMTSRRVEFRLDSCHPVGAAHHQKIVVVDDVLAFCGGLDMTSNRWDTREHLDDDPRRQGHRRKPWHDATTAVDGSVARALGEIARERWRRATGRELEPPPPLTPIWPDELRPTFCDVDVAIARTIPDYDGQAEIREIERLYVDCIEKTRHSIYCETQYFASRRIAEAIARRLAEEDGPEIVIINPEDAKGLIESEVMGASRSRLIEIVRAADRHGRFRFLRPVTRQGRSIYVHAKILVIDDRLLRVGSSNLNNRSMGFDTECDLAFEAAPDAMEKRQTIAEVRNDLIAEHFGIGKERVAAAIRNDGGSLVRAIDRLRADARPGERTLMPIEVEENGTFDDAVADTELFDPERPPHPWRAVVDRVKAMLS